MLRMCKTCAPDGKAKVTGSSPGVLATVLLSPLGHLGGTSEARLPRESTVGSASEARPWMLNSRSWLPQNRPRIYTVGLHAALATSHILPPSTPATPCSLLELLHPGLSSTREVGLTAQQLENLAFVKKQAKRYPGCLAIVSLDRNPPAQWATGFGVQGVVNALRTGSDLIWLLHHTGPA